MRDDGVDGQTELVGDLLVEHPLRHAHQNLLLTRRKLIPIGSHVRLPRIIRRMNLLQYPHRIIIQRNSPVILLQNILRHSRPLQCDHGSVAKLGDRQTPLLPTLEIKDRRVNDDDVRSQIAKPRLAGP